MQTKSTKSGILYHDQGQGMPLVLCHGFAETSAIWDLQVTNLSANYRCIRPEWPGAGISPLGSRPFTMEMGADLINDILRQEGLSYCVVLGHSMGGYIAMAFVEKYESQLLGLGLIHSSAYADDVEKIEIRQKVIEVVRKGGKSAFLRSMIPSLYSKIHLEKQQLAIEKHYSMAMKMSDEGLVQYYNAMIQRPDRRVLLASLACPVLFVIGTDDIAIPQQLMLQQASLPTLAMIEVMPEVGHTSMWEEPQNLNFILNKFCKYIASRKMM